MSSYKASELNIDVDASNSKKQSACWQYFGKLIVIKNSETVKKTKIHVEVEKIWCNPCLLDIKKEEDDDPDYQISIQKIKGYSSAISTSNLIRHLNDVHQLEVSKQAVAERKSSETIKTFFTVSRKKESTSTSQANARWLLARDLALWFCRDLMPFNSVSEEGMIDFMKKYNVIATKEDLPDRTTISRAALDDVYGATRDGVKKIISKIGLFAKSASITFDIWTDNYRRLSYITFGLHFIDDCFQLYTITLSTKHMPQKKTAENIVEEVKSTRKAFNLEDIETVAVTDRGSNVLKACKLASLPHHACIGHGVHNLIMVDGLQDTRATEVIDKCKEIVSALRFRTAELEAEYSDRITPLAEVGEYLNVHDVEIDVDEDVVEHNLSTDKQPPTLKNYVKTRWHTVLLLLSSMGPHRTGINVILDRIDKPHLMLTSGEWLLLEELVKFLELFKTTVEILSSEAQPTINLALVLRSEILDCLEVKDTDSLALAQIKSKMLENIDSRLPVTSLLALGSILDPRFKNLSVLEGYLKKINVTKESFLAEEVRIRLGGDIPAGDSENTSAPASTGICRLMAKHSQKTTAEDKILRECSQYLSFECQGPDQEVLQFWNNNKQNYPNLASVAAKILCVPATSTKPERINSVAGLAINAKRSRLNPNRLDKIVFVHDNYGLVKSSLE